MLMESLMFILTMPYYEPRVRYNFLGEAVAAPRLRSGLSSLCGQQLGGRF